MAAIEVVLLLGLTVGAMQIVPFRDTAPSNCWPLGAHTLEALSVVLALARPVAARCFGRQAVALLVPPPPALLTSTGCLAEELGDGSLLGVSCCLDLLASAKGVVAADAGISRAPRLPQGRRTRL